MSSRLTILPDPRFAEISSNLAARLQQVAASVEPDNFSSLLDSMMKDVIEQGFRDVHADEGTIWLLDAAREHLVPAVNTGPNAPTIVARFRQPLSAGLICMVFASEQPFVENEVFKNARQSKLLDELLQVRTDALMVVPFYFLHGCRGVMSCVQLGVPGSPVPHRPGFSADDLDGLQRMAVLVSRLLEYRLLSQTVGWEVDR